MGLSNRAFLDSSIFSSDKTLGIAKAKLCLNRADDCLIQYTLQLMYIVLLQCKYEATNAAIPVQSQPICNPKNLPT